MNEIIKEELEYIRRGLGKKQQNIKEDITTFKLWEDWQITTEIALKRFLKTNNIPKGYVSEETFIYFVEHLGYVGRRKFNGKKLWVYM